MHKQHLLYEHLNSFYFCFDFIWYDWRSWM